MICLPVSNPKRQESKEQRTEEEKESKKYKFLNVTMPFTDNIVTVISISLLKTDQLAIENWMEYNTLMACPQASWKHRE